MGGSFIGHYLVRCLAELISFTADASSELGILYKQDRGVIIGSNFDQLQKLDGCTHIQNGKGTFFWGGKVAMGWW